MLSNSYSLSLPFLFVLCYLKCGTLSLQLNVFLKVRAGLEKAYNIIIDFHKKKLTRTRGVRVQVRVHVRISVQRWQVHVLHLGQRLEESGLTVKGLDPFGPQQQRPWAQRPARHQRMSAVRKRLERPPRHRGWLLVEAQQLLNPETRAPRRRGAQLPRQRLWSRVRHPAVRRGPLFVLRVRQHSSVFPRHSGTVHSESG